MNRIECLVTALAVCVLLVNCAKAEDAGDLDAEEESTVTMALTKLDVSDTELKLSWKITNNTDHEVWICESINNISPSVFEQFLDKDAKTLVIRRRYDLPVRITGLERRNPAGRYVRLLAGQEKVESISIALPVDPLRISAGESGNAAYAERLAVEIGFYDENLPALILEIVELAEHLNCDLLVGLGEDVELGKRFFGGRQIAQYYYHVTGFGPNVLSADADGEMWMLHMGATRMGEKVLRIEVDGVSIPYKSDYPPLTGQAGKGTKNPRSQKTSNANLAKADNKDPAEGNSGGSGE